MIRLGGVRIQNFRSIKDSGKVDINQDITALIGQNESGKTNFLRALYSFNREYKYSEDEICNINNQRQAFLQSNTPNEIPILTLYFEVELPLPSPNNDNTVQVDELKVTKYFDGHYELDSVKPEGAIEQYIENIEHVLIDEIRRDIVDALEKMEEDNNFENELGSHINEGEYKNYQTALEDDKLTLNKFEDLLSDLHDELSRMRKQANNNNAQNAVNQARNEVNSQRDKARDLNEAVTSGQIYNGDNINDIEILEEDYALLNQLPTFILHENVDHLEDQLGLNEFINTDKNGEHRTFQNLLTLTDLDPERLKQADQGQRLPLTRKASAEITGLVNESWTQESLSIDINVDGDVLTVYLDDESGSMDQPSNRSKGFQWFLGFYVNFTAGTQGEFENSILLLDDPGVYLHPSGQKDLLNTLVELTDENQIIYNTHSPFLIDKDRLDRIRILEKADGTNGTAVSTEFHHNDGDVLAPIRAAFGATLSDSLFGNRQNVLVEGYSDKILLDAFSKYFRRRNRTSSSLDPDRISVINVGGANKMPYFTKLIDTEGYDYLAFLDDDSKGRQTKTGLIDDAEVEGDRVVLLGDIVDGFNGVEAEIEDLFDNEFYYNAVLSSYDDIFDEEQLEQVEMDEIPETSIAKKFENHFEDQSLGRFDKIRVAKEIRSITEQDDCDDEQVGDTTIENYRAMFEEINSAFD